jgi:hypothetical protein
MSQEEHGSDACRCGDFRSDHTDGKICRVCSLRERCTQFVFAYKADAADRAIWEKYHAPRCHL